MRSLLVLAALAALPCLATEALARQAGGPTQEPQTVQSAPGGSGGGGSAVGSDAARTGGGWMEWFNGLVEKVRGLGGRPRPNPTPTPAPTATPAPAPTPGATPTPAPTPTAPPPGPGLWVTGYYAGWFWDWHDSPGAAIAAVDMTTMTHFVFGRYAPGAGSLGGSPGTLVPGAGTGHARVEDALVRSAHNAGIYALAMIGGAGDGKGWVASTAPGARAAFVQAIVDKCVEKDYDGVDIDWEERLDTAESHEQLVALLGELREEAGRRPRYQSPHEPFLVTFPTAYVNVNTSLPRPQWLVTVASLVDQFNLMTYSMTWNCCGWTTWLFSPIDGEAPTHPTSIASSVKAYVDAGVPREKIGMGLGLYASGYAAPASGPRQRLTTHYLWMDYSGTWARLYRAGLLSDEYYHFDDEAQAGYYAYPTPVTFERNAVTTIITEDLGGIAAKGAWAREGNCGGAIVWTINYGFVDPTVGNPPMRAIKEAFLR